MDTAFTPVPVRARHDGWTPTRQRAFITTLAQTRCVVAATRSVGMSWQTAYRLRARPDAAGFAVAWDAALAGPDPDRPVSGRALDGISKPIIYRGRVIGERRRHDNRLAMFILAVRQPWRYGAQSPGNRPGSGENHDVARTSSPSVAQSPRIPDHHGGRCTLARRGDDRARCTGKGDRGGAGTGASDGRPMAGRAP